MKLWNVPSLEEMDLKATAYSPSNGPRVDGAYVSNDKKYTSYTYGPSSGDSGTPNIRGNDPSQYPEPRGGGDSGFAYTE